MDLAETDSHGATARIPAPSPCASDTAAGTARAAAEFLDLWELNQAEIARLGPPHAPSLRARRTAA